MARRLEVLGAHIIDADRLGHRVYEPGAPGFAKVVAAFGQDIVADDGAIDRRRLGALVFGEPGELKRLTDIVWPEIRRLAGAEMAAQRAAQPHGVVVLEAAVMLEAGWQHDLDEVWLVVVDPATAIARCMARDGLSAAEVQARLDAQAGNAARKAKADLVLDNSGGLEALHAKVDREWRRLSRAHRAQSAPAGAFAEQPL